MIGGIPSHLPIRMAGPGQTGSNPAQLKQVTEEFETLFLELILRTMRESTKGFASEQSSYARNMYESWQDQAFARSMAGAGGIGLAAQLYQQLSDRMSATES